LANTPNTRIKMIDHAEAVAGMNKIYGPLYVEDSIPKETYRGMALVGAAGANPVPGQDAVIAFLNQEFVVMGDRTQVKGAVDRWLAANSVSPLAALVNDVSSGSQAWVVATGLTEMQASLGVKPQQGQPNPMLNILDKIDRIGGALSFNDTVTVKGLAVTKTPQDAQALAGVLQLSSRPAPLQTRIASMRRSSSGSMRRPAKNDFRVGGVEEADFDLTGANSLLR